MELGQADGIACRTMEMFEAFEFADSILKEACWINDVTFWKPDPGQPGRIARHGRVQDTKTVCPSFLTSS
jgi:phenol 2-monooxygenase/3-hydroxybenzoate 4-monooxygenase